MRRASKRPGKTLILFNSYLYTIKSVYRKEKEQSVLIHLNFEEEGSYEITLEMNKDELAQYEFLKKGALITVHIGNGGYVCLEEGSHMPEEGYTIGCVIHE